MTIVAPLAICWIGAALVMLGDGRRARVAWGAVALLAAALIATLVIAVDVAQGGARTMVAGDWAPGVGIVLRADALGSLFAAVSLTVILAAVATEALRGVRDRFFPALALFLATGLCGIFLTADIFNFYVFFEISMIAAYVLVAYGQQRPQFRAATLFAVVNLLGSTLFLIGVAAIYHLTGRLDMATIAARAADPSSAMALLPATLLFVAFGVKLGFFPFHFWLATVYTGARPAVAAMLAGALANIGGYGLIRFGGEVLPRELAAAAPALLALGAASVIYGGVQAISRSTMAETLAYSAIGQAGYILVALAIGGERGLAAAALFTAINALNKGALFLGADLRGRAATVVMAIAALSVAGVPPVAGFFGKASLLQAATAADRPFVVALIVLGGFLSLLYLLLAFQRDHHAPRPAEEAVAMAWPRRWVALAMAGLLVAIGIWPQPLLALADTAAAALVGGAP